MAQQWGDRRWVPALGECKVLTIFLSYSGPLNRALDCHGYP
ncbi:MAG: hypothetical protein SNJ57_17965 [Cyanobacteriota bacterium]